MFSGNDFGLNYLYANFGKSRGTIVGAVNSIKRLPNNACFTRTATLLISALCILHVPEPHSFLDVVLFGVCPVSGGSCLLQISVQACDPVSFDIDNARIFHWLSAHKFPDNSTLSLGSSDSSAR